VKCLSCHKPRHFLRKFPNKKGNMKKGNKKSQMTTSTSTKVDDFAVRFENEFSLIACLSSSTNSGVYFIDTGASSHMNASLLLSTQHTLKILIKFCHFLGTTCFLHCPTRFHFRKCFIFVCFHDSHHLFSLFELMKPHD
jgi:hypothetical protein